MNWGQIKTAVKDYLENEETTFVGHFDIYARLAEEDIYRKVQFPAAKQTAVSTVFSGDSLLSIPSDALSIYSLALTSPQFLYLSLKDEAFLREAYPDPAELGEPRFYAVRDDTDLVLAPTPDQDYGVQMHYFYKPVSISFNNVDTNTNWLSLNAENALIFGIIYHGYVYEKGDQDVIAAYKNQFDTALADLKLIMEGRQKKDTYRNPDQRLPT
jgi:hypothetical protein